MKQKQPIMSSELSYLSIGEHFFQDETGAYIKVVRTENGWKVKKNQPNKRNCEVAFYDNEGNLEGWTYEDLDEDLIEDSKTFEKKINKEFEDLYKEVNK